MENDSRIESYEMQTTASTHIFEIETSVSPNVDEIISLPNMDIKDLNIPLKYKQDIQKAIEILKKGGCESVYLYGSMLSGKIHEGSDRNIGIKGLSDEKFYEICGMVYMKVDSEVNIIDFDDSINYYLYLKSKKGVVQID